MAPGAGDQEACDKPRNRNDYEQEEAEAAEIQPFESKFEADFLIPSE
jgi:hypothetical protein